MKGAATADFQHHFVVDDVPTVHTDSPSRVAMTAQSDLGTLKLNSVIGRSFVVMRGQLDFKHNVVIEAPGQPADKVSFYMLEHGRGGSPSFGDGRYGPGHAIDGKHTYFAFNPSLPEKHFFEAQTSRSLYLELNADYFASMLDSDDKFTGSLKEKIGNRDFFGMNSAFNRVMHRAFASIYECPLEGSLGNLMIEGSLQQFLALQLSPFVQPILKNVTMTTRDKDILHAVKDYLHNTFHENHSLLDLSRHFGINQNKLKRSFKELFGVPVIEYLYTLKMEHARRMLFDQGMYVGEVASMVGYKNANHFSTAFKRKFGVNPSRV